MAELTLNAESRDLLGKKVKILRREGQIPAVLYGRSFKSLSLILDKKEFFKTFREAGEATIINLEIPGKEKFNALIRDIQKDPVTDEILHVDLYKVDMHQEIQTEIPLKFVGVAPAVEEQEGNFITNKDSLKVACLPDRLVPEIEVDIAVLKAFEDLIHIKDLKIPEGIEVLDDPDDIIAQVTAPLSEEELKALEAEEAVSQEKAQIETIEAEAVKEKTAKGEIVEEKTESEAAPAEKKGKAKSKNE